MPPYTWHSRQHTSVADAANASATPVAADAQISVWFRTLLHHDTAM